MRQGNLNEIYLNKNIRRCYRNESNEIYDPSRQYENSSNLPVYIVDFVDYDYTNLEVDYIAPEEIIIRHQFEIKNELVRFLIGIDHKVMSEIQRISGTKIMIKSSMYDPNFDIIETRGCKYSVIEAIHRMKEIVRDQTKKYFDEEIYFERAYCLLKIHSNILGFVIGDRGRTINMIFEKTGASIDIEPFTVGKVNQVISIKGSIEQVVRAHEEVCDILKAFSRSRTNYHPWNNNNNTRYEPFEHKMMINDHYHQAQINIPPYENYIKEEFNDFNDINMPKWTIYTDQDSQRNIPEVLVLQEDNTFQPAPVIYQPLPKSVDIIESYEMSDKYKDNVPNVKLTGKAFGLFSGDMSISTDTENQIIESKEMI